MARERIELRLPEPPVAGDPPDGLSQGIGHEAATVNSAVPLAREQPRALEDAQVLGDGGKRDGEGPGQRRDR